MDNVDVLRIVKFTTDKGPVYIDLEEVSLVTHGFEGNEGKTCVHLKDGSNWFFNSSFREDFELMLDAWMEFGNNSLNRANL